MNTLCQPLKACENSSALYPSSARKSRTLTAETSGKRIRFSASTPSRDLKTSLKTAPCAKRSTAQWLRQILTGQNGLNFTFFMLSNINTIVKIKTSQNRLKTHSERSIYFEHFQERSGALSSTTSYNGTTVTERLEAVSASST